MYPDINGPFVGVWNLGKEKKILVSRIWYETVKNKNFKLVSSVAAAAVKLLRFGATSLHEA